MKRYLLIGLAAAAWTYGRELHWGEAAHRLRHGPVRLVVENCQFGPNGVGAPFLVADQDQVVLRDCFISRGDGIRVVA